MIASIVFGRNVSKFVINLFDEIHFIQRIKYNKYCNKPKHINVKKLHINISSVFVMDDINHIYMDDINHIYIINISDTTIANTLMRSWEGHRFT